MKRHVIVGLGNPGTKYEWTRHNLGFIVARAFAKKHELKFKKEREFSGEVATGVVGEKQLILLLPMTYMNLSGSSVRALCDYYKIAFQDSASFVVIVDDVYIPFGQMRLRQDGSSGGHNGLKSIEEHLQTRRYGRLRMGIGPENEEMLRVGPPLEEYVLDAFTSSEMKALPHFVESGISVLESWHESGWEESKKRLGQIMRSQRREEE